MRSQKKTGSKKVKNVVEKLESLSKSDLRFIRGGDEQNTESDDKKNP